MKEITFIDLKNRVDSMIDHMYNIDRTYNALFAFLNRLECYLCREGTPEIKDIKMINTLIDGYNEVYPEVIIEKIEVCE